MVLDNLDYFNHEQLYEICNPLVKKKFVIYDMICLTDGRNAIFKYNIIKAWFLES